MMRDTATVVDTIMSAGIMVGADGRVIGGVTA